MDPTWLLPVLFVTGLVAGFVDSIVGGGGLITIPVLLSVNMAPQDALGTNKLQATFGSGSAVWHYSRAGLVRFEDCRLGILCTAIGALLGTFLVQHVDPAFLKQFIPVLLVVIALYFLLQPKVGAVDAHHRIKPHLFYIGFGLLLGFYDGFFGPGTGSFWAMAYILGLGFNLTKATAHTKMMNFTSNLASLSLFVLGNHVNYGAGLVMGLGQLAGAKLGSGMVIRNGVRFIRPIFITAVLAITFKLLWETFYQR